MAATDELQTDRLDGVADDGVALAQKFPNFEAAMRHIFGIPADTAMSEAMQIGTGPNIVMSGSLSLAGAPTTDLMAATKAYFQSQGSGMGNVRARAYLTSNKVSSFGSDKISWDVANINEGTVWSAANPTRFTIPAGGDGDYLVGATVSIDPDVTKETSFMLYIWKNRAGSTYNALYEEDREFLVELGGSIIMYANDCSAGDYLELEVNRGQSSRIMSANTTFWMFNLE